MLVDALVDQGVSRTIARQLARDKPEVCRRCLDYLPFVKIRTTPGAWLAHAIRDEYGPPEGYQKANAPPAERTQGVPAVTEASRTDIIARQQQKDARLRERYRQMQETHGEALAAFDDYVASERAKAERIAHWLTPSKASAYLAGFDNEDRRVELFAAWLQRRSAPSFVVPGTARRRRGENPVIQENRGAEKALENPRP